MIWACGWGVFSGRAGVVFRIRCAVGGLGRRARACSACRGVQGRAGACRGVQGRAGACRGVQGYCWAALGGWLGLLGLVSVVVVGGEQGFGGAPVVGESYGGAPRGACDACWGVPELPAEFFG